MSQCKSPLSKVACLLVLIGAINWGLVGAFKVDLVQLLLGGIPFLRDLVYILVGLAGLYKIAKCMNCKKSDSCSTGSCSTK